MSSQRISYLAAFALATFALASCVEETRSPPPGGSGGAGGSPPLTCGDGKLDAEEECDGAELGGNSCQSLGYDTGSLGCTKSCAFDTSQCVLAERCTNDADDDGDGLTDCDDPDCASACADSCPTATELNDPLTVTGSTLGHANKLDSSCASPMGSGPEVVYSFTAAHTGVLDLRLVSNDDLTISIRPACEQPAELGCSDNALGPDAVERLKVPVTQGQTVFVIVEGTSANDAGSFAFEIESRPIACGDGFTDGTEECDDGNTNSGDGCSAQCSLESSEVEPNDTSAQANSYLAPWVAALSPAGDVDLVKVSVASSPAYIVAETRDLDQLSCASGLVDTFVEILDTDGMTELAVDDDSAEGTCSKAIAAGLSPGDYYVRVSAPPGASQPSFAYVLDLQVKTDVCGDGMITPSEQCDDGNTATGDGCDASCQFELSESEPNGTSAEANAFSAPWHAAISPSGDVDLVSIAVPGPSSTLTAQVIDHGTGDCLANKIISFMEILDTNGSSVLTSDAGSGPGYCAYAKVQNLAAGTYYVRVKAGPLSPNATFSYGLALSVQ